jgi:Na+/glutamate symporter
MFFYLVLWVGIGTGIIYSTITNSRGGRTHFLHTLELTKLMSITLWELSHLLLNLFTGIKLMSVSLWELSDLYLFTGIKLVSMKVWELSDL